MKEIILFLLVSKVCTIPLANASSPFSYNFAYSGHHEGTSALLILPPCPPKGGLKYNYYENQGIIPPSGGDLTATWQEDRGLSNQINDTIKFYDGQQFTIIGRFHSEKNYARFPDKYENTLRKEVWSLGQHSAGISIRFRSNSPFIAVRWSVKNDAVMDHMPFTGIKGVDLYSLVDGKWKYINTGRVKGKSNEFMMVRGAGEDYREYLLNLPLYDGADTVLIGISSSSSISVPQDRHLISEKPVVYYGSSIAQGGCASRPGLLFTNILARSMDRPFINMGFSGNGTFDLSVGDALCETDAALYVIDCNPNTRKELIYERAVELVMKLHRERPEVPVLFVEAYPYVSGFAKPSEAENAKKNLELKRAYESLRDAGIKNLYYRKGDDLIGFDYEGTVDGVHPNDIGMIRIAEALEPTIRKLVK